MALKKLVVMIAALLILSVGAFAAWQYNLSTNITGNVVSVEPNEVLYFEGTLESFGNINASYQAVSINRSIMISNQNGLIPLTFYAVETITDIDDDCIDYLNDIEIKYFIDGIEIYTNQSYDFQSGDVELSVMLNAVKGACPQELDISLGFI